MGPLLTSGLIAGATAGGALAGRGIARRGVKKREQRLDATLGGQAQLRSERDAAARSITGNYGKTDAQHRKDIATATAGATQDANARRAALAGVARAQGGLGRSGATLEAEKGIAKSQTQARALAGQGSLADSTRAAAANKAADSNVLGSAYVRSANLEDALAAAGKMGAQTGAKVGSQFANKLTGMGISGTEAALNAPAKT
jgi:hypothetical protein